MTGGPASPLVPSDKRRILFLAFGLSLLSTAGISGLMPSLARLAETFAVSPEASLAAVTAFALPGMALILPAGFLADRIGRKAVLLPALLLFAGGGTAAFFATTFTELLGCRFIQGMGAAPLGLLHFTILADAFEGHERMRAMSLNAMVLGLGSAINPMAGGLLGGISPRLPLLLCLPALLLLLPACKARLHGPSPTLTAARYFKDARLCFSSYRTASILGFSFLLSLMLSGPIITVYPLLAEYSFSASPLAVGLCMAAASCGAGVAAPLVPRLCNRYSLRTALLIGLGCYAASFMAFQAVSFLWASIVPMLLFGFGQGICIPLTAGMLSAEAPSERRGILMAGNSILLRLAQSCGASGFSALCLHYSPASAMLAALPLPFAAALLLKKIR